MKKLGTRSIALIAVMAAVTCVFTLIRFPIPGTRGYIHLGDIAANFAALAFGPWFGLVIAGGGMALADILGGYPFWAPATFIIHGLQGFVIGYIANFGRSAQSNRLPVGPMFVGAVLGEVIMVVGYFIAGIFIEGIGAAIVGIPWNAVQGVFGILGVPLFLMVARAYPPLIMRRGPHGDSHRDQ